MLAVVLIVSLGAITDVQAVPGRAGDVAPSIDYSSDLDRILAEVVTANGLVRYDRLRNDLNPLFRRVLKAIEEFDASTLSSQSERLAFWLNAYNVQILQSVLDAPGLENIVEDGFADAFFQTPFRIARMSATLDQVEHVILRGKKGPAALQELRLVRLDPRIHVGLNCAAVGCPRLQDRAFRPESVDSVLDRAMRAFVNDPNYFRRDGRRWVFSSLLEWFGDDFDAIRPAGDYLRGYIASSRPDADALRALLAGRKAADLKNDPSIRFAYDWTLNAAGDE